MALIKNEIVKMDWDAEGFFETKKNGFVAATHVYETPKGACTVLFKDRVACMIYDEETKMPATVPELTKALAEIVKQGGADEPIEDFFPDSHIPLCNGVEVDSDLAEFYGFTEEQCEDILARVEDLDGYYETITTDAQGNVI